LGGRRGVERRGGVAEADLFALHVAGWLVRHTGCGYGWVGLVLGDRGDGQPAAEDDHHHAEDGRTLADAADHLAEGVGEPDRDAQDERYR
jgi:hypothetical protein